MSFFALAPSRIFRAPDPSVPTAERAYGLNVCNNLIVHVDPETKRVLGVALEMTRVSLGLADDLANGIIAKRIIELAKAGERNPDLLCQGALEKLRGYLFGD
jgi:hypothetical protein